MLVEPGFHLFSGWMDKVLDTLILLLYRNVYQEDISHFGTDKF